jgi:hypothetical protein
LMQWSLFSRPICSILNFTPRGELGPRGEICSLGGMFTPSFTPHPGENTLYCLHRRMKGQTENFTPRGQIHYWRTTLRLGVKVCP